MCTIQTILFDVGGVLSHDGHETYLSHEKYGLARKLGIPNDEIFSRTVQVFRKYAVLPKASEAEFWKEIGDALGTRFSVVDIDTVKQQIQDVNKDTEATFELLHSRDIKIGIISNSTPFFYPTIASKLQFNKHVQPDLLFLSHVCGHLKSNGLFELAAASLNPAHTFILDDRPKNVVDARKLGFRSVQYSIESGMSLLELADEITCMK